MIVFAFPKEIKIQWEQDDHDKTNERNGINQWSVYITSTYFINKIFNKWIGKVLLPQLFLYVPLPVRNRAITPAIPDPQDKPAGSRYTNRNKVSFSQARKDPCEEVETDDRQMKKSVKKVEGL